MAVMFVRFHRALDVLDERLVGSLRGRRVVRFQRILKTGEIIVELAVIGEKLAERIFSGVALQIVLKGRQGALGRAQIARLNGAADAFEVLEELAEPVR